MQRLIPLNAVCDDAEFVSAPWHKEMKAFEIPSSLAYAFAQLLAACGFKVDKESHTWLTCDMCHVSRFIGPPNLTDRANKLTSLTYFANGKKRKPLTKKEMEKIIPDEWLTHSEAKFETKNTFELYMKDIVSSYTAESNLAEDEWNEISMLEGYTAVVVNRGHPFKVRLLPSTAGMARVQIAFSYGRSHGTPARCV